MVTSPLPKGEEYAKTWCHRGDSGAVVYGPGDDGDSVAGIVMGGDKAPDWRDCGSSSEHNVRWLEREVRGVGLHFFAPIEAVVAHVQARLEEDLGGKVTVELFLNTFEKQRRAGMTDEEIVQDHKERLRRRKQEKAGTGMTESTEAGTGMTEGGQ